MSGFIAFQRRFSLLPHKTLEWPSKFLDRPCELVLGLKWATKQPRNEYRWIWEQIQLGLKPVSGTRLPCLWAAITVRVALRVAARRARVCQNRKVEMKRVDEIFVTSRVLKGKIYQDDSTRFDVRHWMLNGVHAARSGCSAKYVGWLAVVKCWTKISTVMQTVCIQLKQRKDRFLLGWLSK